MLKFGTYKDNHPLQVGEFNLINIEVLDSIVSTSDEYKKAPSEPSGTQVNINVDFFDITGNAINDLNLGGVVMRLLLIGKQSNNVDIGLRAEFTYRFTYVFLNLSDYYARNGSDEIGTASKAILANIAYSTSRGLVFGRLLGTPLSKSIIPILDSYSFVDSSSSLNS